MSEFSLLCARELVKTAYRKTLITENLPRHLLMCVTRLSEVPVRGGSHRKDSFPEEESCPTLAHEERSRQPYIIRHTV